MLGYSTYQLFQDFAYNASCNYLYVLFPAYNASCNGVSKICVFLFSDLLPSSYFYVEIDEILIFHLSLLLPSVLVLIKKFSISCDTFINLDAMKEIGFSIKIIFLDFFWLIKKFIILIFWNLL